MKGARYGSLSSVPDSDIRSAGADADTEPPDWYGSFLGGVCLEDIPLASEGPSQGEPKEKGREGEGTGTSGCQVECDQDQGEPVTSLPRSDITVSAVSSKQSFFLLFFFLFQPKAQGKEGGGVVNVDWVGKGGGGAGGRARRRRDAGTWWRTNWRQFQGPSFNPGATSIIVLTC